MTALRTKPDTGTAHTEGPWIAAAGPSSIVGWPVVAQTGRLICNIATPPKDINRVGKEKEDYDAFMAECEANARLIAAAPMMRSAMDALGFGGDRADEKIGWRGNYPQPSSNSHFRCEFCAAEHMDCTEIPHAKYCPVTICRAASEGRQP